MFRAAPKGSSLEFVFGIYSISVAMRWDCSYPNISVRNAKVKSNPAVTWTNNVSFDSQCRMLALLSLLTPAEVQMLPSTTHRA